MTVQTDPDQTLADPAVTLRLVDVLPGPVPPAPDLDALLYAPDRSAGSPADVDPGLGEVEAVLDQLTPEVEALRRRFTDLPAKGFMTTAADRQRAREIERLLGEISRVLAERA